MVRGLPCLAFLARGPRERSKRSHAWAMICRAASRPAFTAASSKAARLVEGTSIVKHTETRTELASFVTLTSHLVR